MQLFIMFIKRNIHVFILLTFFSALIKTTFSQDLYPLYYHVITIKSDSFQLKDKSYYVQSVIDGRADTTKIGIIKEGLFDSKYPAKLDTSLNVSLYNYFQKLLPEESGKTPILIRITKFEISEKADANSENGKTIIGMEFYKKDNDLYQKIYETEQFCIYNNFDVTEMHESKIRETIVKCFNSFSFNDASISNNSIYTYHQLLLTPKNDNVAYKELYKQKVYFSKMNFTVSGGYGVFFENLNYNYPKELDTYLKGCKYTYNYGAEFVFYFFKPIGLSYNYYTYDSKNSIEYFKLYDDNNKLIKDGKIANIINIKKYGPGLYYRSVVKNSNTVLKASLSFNKIHYTDNAVLFDKINVTDINTNAITSKFDIDYYLFKNVALNFSISAWYAKIKAYELNGVLTEISDKSNMLRSDAHLGITLCY